MIITADSEQGGYGDGFWTSGQMSFSAVVLIVNIKVALFSNTFNFLNIFILVGSFLVYLLSFLVLSQMKTFDIYGDFTM